MTPADKEAAQRAMVLRHLARSLSDATATFERRGSDIPRTFPDYKKARAAYLEIQAIAVTIQDKAAEGGNGGVGADLKSWLLRNRLRAIATFVRLSVGFFRDPPDLLVQALGAHEILEMEREALSKLLREYDMMLLEAAVDDQMAGQLDKVYADMEEIVRLLDALLRTAPPPLASF